MRNVRVVPFPAAFPTSRRLGIEAVDPGGLTCCPEKGLVKTPSHNKWLLAAARNLGIAGKPP